MSADTLTLSTWVYTSSTSKQNTFTAPADHRGTEVLSCSVPDEDDAPSHHALSVLATANAVAKVQALQRGRAARKALTTEMFSLEVKRFDEWLLECKSTDDHKRTLVKSSSPRCVIADAPVTPSVHPRPATTRFPGMFSDRMLVFSGRLHPL